MSATTKYSLFLNDILSFLKEDIISVVGNNDDQISHAESLFDAKFANSISYCTGLGKKAKQSICSSSANFIICHPIENCDVSKNKVLIYVKDPRLCFVRVLSKFFVTKKISCGLIHETAIIDPEASLHPSVSIGPYVVLGKCSIGANSTIHAFTHIYDDVQIGNNVVIYSGAKIGKDGFGFVRNQNHELERFHHFGRVIIEDNVEIGANCCVSKGALDATIIKKGTKVDDLVHVAHNVEIGENCVIIANSVICGGVKIGNCSWVAPSSTIREKISIGENVFVGIGSVVLRDVKSNLVVFGNPAKTIREQ